MYACVAVSLKCRHTAVVHNSQFIRANFALSKYLRLFAFVCVRMHVAGKGS